MFTMDCLGLDEKGELLIGGARVSELAERFGTPLYVMDEGRIRENCRKYRDALKSFNGDSLVIYASKAFLCKQMCRIVAEEGLGIDVVSGGELYTAMQAGFPVERIYFHGNNKSPDELKMAVEAGVGRIVVDNRTELERLQEIAASAGRKVDISLRIKPGVEAHTHEFIKTGQIDSKFGFALETGEAEEICEYAANLPNINLVGTHFHIGSQIFSEEPFLLSTDVIFGFIVEVRDRYGINFSEINLGGGCGVKYSKDDQPIDIAEYAGRIAEHVNTRMKEIGLENLALRLEPGRSIVAPAGLTVYTVGAVKDIPGVRKYVMVDGGMADNPRYVTYQAEYDALVVGNPQGEAEEVVTVAGKCCESGDILIKNIKLPKVEVGDLLVVLSTGGYNYSMSSNYNRLPRPPVVMVRDGEARVVVKRESYEDIIRNDV